MIGVCRKSPEEFAAEVAIRTLRIPGRNSPHLAGHLLKAQLEWVTVSEWIESECCACTFYLHVAFLAIASYRKAK